MLVSGGTVGASAANGECTRVEVIGGLCGTTQPPTSSGAVDGDRVDVRAEVRRDGTPAAAPEGAAPAPGGVDSGDVEFVYRNAADCGSADAIAANELCRNDFAVTLDGTDIPWQPITMADIESFRPAPPAVAGEPDGWAVVGLPVNLVADTSPEIVPGVLLGEPAEVRFTPVGYSWDYGDGTSRTIGAAGATWEELGLAQFAPTVTSHVYSDRGTVSIQLTVTYVAEYRFLGPGWAPVLGELMVSTGPLPLRVVTAATMLVDGECGGGPGC